MSDLEAAIRALTPNPFHLQRLCLSATYGGYQAIIDTEGPKRTVTVARDPIAALAEALRRHAEEEPLPETKPGLFD